MDLRRQGSAALDICYVAANRNVLFFECILSPWDYAAASCILREAGGVLMTMDGEPADLNVKTSIMAGAPAASPGVLAAEMIGIIADYPFYRCHLSQRALIWSANLARSLLATPFILF